MTTTKTKDHLTEQERELLAIFRQLDPKQQRHVMLAAQSVQSTAEKKREFWI